MPVPCRISTCKEAIYRGGACKEHYLQWEKERVVRDTAVLRPREEPQPEAMVEPQRAPRHVKNISCASSFAAADLKARFAVVEGHSLLCRRAHKALLRGFSGHS